MTTSPESSVSPEPPKQQHEPVPPVDVPVPPASDPSARFFHWIRSWGVQRSTNRWVGGVCGGLATKWGIDPVIVRGLAVVLTLFFGIGLLAYGVAWALLPEPDARIHAEEVARGRWSTGMTGASAATLLGLGGPGTGLFFGDNDGWSLWSALWIGGIAWLIYWSVNRDKTKGVAPGSTSSPATPPPTTRAPQQQWQDPTQHLSAASWQGTEPLHPATFQSNPALYVKTKPVTATAHLGAAASFLVIGVATIVGAAILLLDASNVLNLGGYEDGIAAAGAAITAGLGIVLAGATGRTAGGLGTFAIVALISSALLSLGPVTNSFTSFNQSSWAPATISEAQVGRSMVLGNATLDLTKLDGGTPLSNDVHIPLNLVVSNVTVRIPDDVPVRLVSELAVASLTIDGENTGRALAESSTTEINPEAAGKALVITLQGAATNVEIVQENAP